MKIIKKNGRDLTELNILIYAEDSEKLWEYRDLCYRIKGELRCEMHITLTNKMETVWNMINLLSGNIDIFLSDIPLEESQIRELDLQLQSYDSEYYHIIIKKETGYIDICRVNKNIKCIEHWKTTKNDLEEKLFHLISKMQRTH